jgi:hypothetical protein
MAGLGPRRVDSVEGVSAGTGLSCIAQALRGTERYRVDGKCLSGMKEAGVMWSEVLLMYNRKKVNETVQGNG